jgi:hypothetical protein
VYALGTPPGLHDALGHSRTRVSALLALALTRKAIIYRTDLKRSSESRSGHDFHAAEAGELHRAVRPWEREIESFFAQSRLGPSRRGIAPSRSTPVLQRHDLALPWLDASADGLLPSRHHLGLGTGYCVWTSEGVPHCVHEQFFGEGKHEFESPAYLAASRSIGKINLRPLVPLVVFSARPPRQSTRYRKMRVLAGAVGQTSGVPKSCPFQAHSGQFQRTPAPDATTGSPLRGQTLRGLPRSRHQA